jgi:hypothetical protein
MKNRRFIKHLVIALTAALVAVSIGLVTKGGNAHGDTTTGTLVGEGGDAMTPVMLSLLSDDASQLLPDTASYTNVNLNQAISDFVGTAPGSFAADFAVSERALTTAEAAQAVADGRSYAYVPFAATPDALMTLVPNSTYDGGSTISASQYCQHIPLSLTQLDGIYGAPQDTDWSALTCPASSTGTSTTTTTGASTTTTTEASTTTTTTASSTPLDAQPIALYGNADPTMENYALMALLDSTSTSQTAYGNLLTTLSNENRADQTSPAPTETWPFPSTAVVGGDEATLGKIVGLVPRTGAPSTEVSQLALGAIMPVASVWTGDPLGVPWNLPTAAVENAAGSFVPPSTTAAAAAEADATLASTSDPTTNNLVTFQPNTNDSAAYNSDLMLESYLVVPTNGLSSDKALALAQLVRFVLGSEGQKDITALGAAPATTAMVTAGLQFAQELDVEAATTTDATAADCSTSTTTTTPSSSTSTSTTPSSSTTTTSTSTTSTTTPTSGSTTTTTVPCTTTTTTTGSTTTGSTTTVPTSTVCAPTTSTTTPSTSTSTSTTSPSTSTTTTSPSTSTTTTSPSTSTTTTSQPTSTTTTSQPTSTTTTSQPTSTTTTSSSTTTTSESTTTTSESTTTTTAADQNTTTTAGADADTSTTSTSPSTSTTSTSPSTTTTTGPSTTTTTAPPTTTTTICPTTTATTVVTTDDDGGSPSDLAFTGMNPVPLVALGFLFFIFGEIGLRALRKRLGRR